EVRYRATSRAAARVTNAAGAASLAQGADAGVRSSTLHVESPAPRTTADCESAAAALLDDGAGAAVSGTYRVPRALLPGDIQPGDAISFDLQSRGTTYSGTVRAVNVDLQD